MNGSSQISKNLASHQKDPLETIPNNEKYNSDQENKNNSPNSTNLINNLGQTTLNAVSNDESDFILPQSDKVSTILETEKTAEIIKEARHMKYGSERFENITTNNHNEVYFEDIIDTHKLVLGKDAVLVLPSNPDKLNVKSGYPTHQESWLPIWYVLLNHSQAQTPKELEYQEKIAEKISDQEYQKVDRAVLYKSIQFLEDYKNDHTHDDNPRKKYKKLTRILQDNLLYIGRKPGVIENQQAFLEKSPLSPLIKTANEMRRGENLDKAPFLETQIELILKNLIDQYGGMQTIEQSYQSLRQEIDNNQGDQRVVLLPDKTLADAEFYTKLTSCDLLMSRDDHDEDIISIIPDLKKGAFYQVNEKFGKNLSKERRTDIIAVSEDLEVWETIGGGKESYQPVSMIIATHSTPESESGKKLQDRLQNEMTPELIAHHYLGASEEFLNISAWGKSYVERINRDIPQIKKVIPLYRVATDLMPRAIYMLKTGNYPTSISDEELWKTGESTELVEKIHVFFKRQDATQEELEDTYQRISKKFAEWYDPSDYQTFLDNISLMADKARQDDA